MKTKKQLFYYSGLCLLTNMVGSIYGNVKIYILLYICIWYTFVNPLISYESHWKLVWRDEFDNSVLDTDNWEVVNEFLNDKLLKSRNTNNEHLTQ